MERESSCPVCDNCDGRVVIERVAWEFCRAHQVRWLSSTDERAEDGPTHTDVGTYVVAKCDRFDLL